MPIVIADHAFNKDGSFRYEENVDLGFRGDTILVNGAVSPRMKVERRKYRLRFLNGSNARSYALRLGNGRPMLQIAGDGGLLAAPVTRTRVPFHPAERIDLVLDFSAYGPGEELVLNNEDGARRHRADHALRRRGRRRQRGLHRSRRACASPSRCRAPTPAAAGTSRSAPPRGRSTGWASTPTASTPARAAAARRSGRSSTTPTACTRCTCTASSSACWSARARPVEAADKLGWKDTVGVLPNETVTVLAWFAPYARQVRVPLPRARARRQGHDAADGGRVMRLTIAGVTRGRRPGLAGARRSPTPRSRPIDGTLPDGSDNRWTPNAVDGQGRRDRHLVVRRHRAPAQRQVRERRLGLLATRPRRRRRAATRTRSRRRAPTSSSASCTRRRCAAPSR